MTDPPAAPGPPGGHDATQAFPAGGAPPPPPASPPPGAPVPPAAPVPPSAPGDGPGPGSGTGPAQGYPADPTQGYTPDPTQAQGYPPGPAQGSGYPADPTQGHPTGPGQGYPPGSAPTYAPDPAQGYTTGPAPGYPTGDPTRATGYPSGSQGGGPPTAPAPTPPSSGRRRGKGRIVGRALLVLIVIGALAGATAWGFVNRSSAEKWRDRSETADAALEESLDRVEVTSGDLEDAQTRLRDLANEKAGETDRNRILSEIVAQAPEVTAALADCQQETTDLANDIIAAFGDPASDAAAFEERIDEVNEICETALAQAEDLVATIEGLGI
ncbi:MAG TPA: hypothetical protein VK507_12230 [Iamia sp.]|nr:hypothetical protein [Iamia sp.]